MNKVIYSGLVVFSLLSFNPSVLSHAEHDKPRYVAENGVDQGRCDSAKAPCQSIRYAAQHANKGDNIRVASGNYQIDDTDTLFYLLSQTLPIHGNYNREDLFRTASKENITRLIGVPLEYVEQLSEKGFTVIVDSKRQDPEQQSKLQNKLDVYSRLQKSKAEENCVDGFSGDHPCDKIDLLAHVPLNRFSTNPAEANDIWGHFDLNDNKEYALIGLRNGIGIVEVTNPTTPRVVTTLPSQSTIWRDLKVYQFYDHAENRWKSYAYVTADNASVGLLVIDLNNLPESAAIASNIKVDLSAHNVYLSNVDYSTGVALTGKTAYLHIAGSNNNGGAFNTYGLINPINPNSVYKPTTATRNDYSHDVSSMVITDNRKDTQCVNGTDHCEVFFDFNENNFQLWDKTINSNPARLSTTTYTNASYVHSGWYTEDKLVVIVHDELDEQNVGLNTTVRFFDMSDLTNPVSISTWTGPTRAIDHNGFVRGNRYYMSNYERGMTVLDITNPASPTDVGFFDTYPLNDSASFNGAWGVYPYLPSGNILVSDINSGLYILRDKTLTSNQGSLSFTQRAYTVDEGQNISISVNRINGTQGIIQVGWELLKGAADENDFTLNQGSLQWVNGDSEPKLINIVTLEDELTEANEIFFIRLFDPRNGATISQPNIATISINSNVGNGVPSVSAGDDLTVTTGTLVTITATAADPDGESINVLWSQTSGEAVTLSSYEDLVTSFTPTLDGSYTFEVTVTDPQNNSASDSIVINSTQFNNAPTVNAGADINATVNDLITLNATASDADGDALTFSWQQTLGTNVTLSATNSLQTSFTASAVGNYSFMMTVTDSKGLSVTDTVNVNISALPSESSSGGGSFGIILIMFMGFTFYQAKKQFSM